MDRPIRTPEEILAYRTLRQILASGTRDLWSVGPRDNVETALRLMADKNIGVVIVLDQDELAGIVSERDCVRRAVLPGQSIQTVPVADIMTREVVTVDDRHTFADCLRLMHKHGIRHLPVVNGRKVEAVVSIRDLLAEAVAHHAKIISALERERLMIFTSMA